MATCTYCTAVNTESARFCDQCGRRLGVVAAAAPAPGYTPRHLDERLLQSRAAQVGERKRVTILFADIKGSTQLAEQAGAEAWHAILDRYFAILGAAVHRYEGTINQYTGDGVMALFGAPLALEDHAQHACRAALEAQREVRHYADELRLGSGLNLSMRIGLNSGEVVVGRIGDDLRMDYTAQGPTVNLAARMEHICEPGQIYCTRATASQVEGYFALRDLGEAVVAGVSAPVRVYAVEGEGPARSRLERGFARGASAFVGREAELAQLQAALAHAQGGEGGLVALIGEAGIGKSRLCHEFAQDCRARGISVHRASGVPYAAAVPLLPVQSLTRSRLGLDDQTPADEARQLAAGRLVLFERNATDLLPQLLDFLGVGTAPLRADVIADRERLFEFLAYFLPRADSPQVLLIEDLHFADTASEALIAALAQQLAGTSTLLLLNFRPDYTATWLPHTATRIALAALDDAAIERVALGLLGDALANQALAQQLRQRAGGNPFFVEEAVQALHESGYLSGSHGAYVLQRTIAEWPIPDSVHALVAARIDQLEESLKTMLQYAAVMGRALAPGALAQLCGLDTAECDMRLRRLVDTRFLVAPAQGDGVYEFVHPLLQDVAYRSQLQTQRASTHAQLASLMEAAEPLTAPPSANAVAIAYHWRRAGEWARAGAWNLHATRWTGMRDALTTERQFKQALHNLDRAEPSAEVDRLRIMACAGAIRQAQFSEVPFDEVEARYAQGCAIADAHADVAGRVELQISHCATYLRRGDARGAVNLAIDALERAIAGGLPQVIGRFRLLLLLCASAAGYPREGIALINRSSGEDWLRAPISDDNYLSRALYGYMLGWLGQLGAARAESAAAIAHAERIGAFSSWMYANQVELALLTGEYEGVLAPAQRALQVAESFGSPFFRAIALRSLGLAYVLQGDPQRAVPLLLQAQPLVALGRNAHQFEASVFATLARAYSGIGDFERAHAAADQGIRSAQRSSSRVWEIFAWLPLLELPVGGPWSEQARAGLHRVEYLLEMTGAEAARPWWWLAQERWSDDAARRKSARAQALQSFASIGATAQVRRLGSSERRADAAVG